MGYLLIRLDAIYKDRERVDHIPFLSCIQCVDQSSTDMKTLTTQFVKVQATDPSQHTPEL